MFTRCAIAALGFAFISGCVDRSPPEYVPLASRAVTDGCGVQSAATEYYSWGRQKDVRVRIPRSFGEFWVSHFAYDGDDPERYRVRDQNIFKDLLAFILSQDGYEVRGGCSSRIVFGEIPAGRFSMNFFSPDARTLCVRTTEDDHGQPPFVTSRSCTDVASGRNAYDVIIDR